VLSQHDFRAGKYKVGYQSCDDSTAQAGGFDYFKCGSNAKAYGQAARLVAVIGPYNSQCAQVEIPIVNRASSGAVPMISPSTTYVGLTHAGAAAPPKVVGSYYPTGVRNFVRVVAPDDLQGAGEALLAKGLGVRRIYVLDDAEPYGQAIAAGTLAAARKLGLSIAGSSEWNPRRTTYAGLAARIASTHPDAIVLGGVDVNGGAVVRALRHPWQLPVRPKRRHDAKPSRLLPRGGRQRRPRLGLRLSRIGLLPSHQRASKPGAMNRAHPHHHVLPTSTRPCRGHDSIRQSMRQSALRSLRPAHSQCHLIGEQPCLNQHRDCRTCPKAQP
jgi:Periplasmic binding protein